MLTLSAPYRRPVFAEGLDQPRTPLRQTVTAATRLPEPQAVDAVMPLARQSASEAQATHRVALQLASTLRGRKSDAGRAGLVQNILQEYSLSSQEGVALMCLAEALLRVPDRATRDALIRDKIATGDWKQHLGHSSSLFVNAATWGLLITGRLVSTHSEKGLAASLGQIISRGGEPLIRKSVDMAIRMMGEQFVCGETIGEALRHAKSCEAKGFRYSYDMLGEAALTQADAERYFGDYARAIDAIGKDAKQAGIVNGPGISIKLSALHPRYSRAQYARVMEELYPRVLQLAVRAHGYDIGLNIDAEEADRLELSLDLLERLCFAPELEGWDGIGFVIQAYQKRCPYVIDALIDLAQRSRHRLMIRLVKGAYWDSEIKRAQVDGQKDYPVYTRKAHTDVAYLACARKLLAAPSAIYPQFATHNAHTVAAIHQMADPSAYWPGQYEFQCLHGMGEPLYEQVVASREQGGLDRPCRIYAPVGTHETLLAYLVRRLLENGANTSFVNRIADPKIPIESLIEDPVLTVENTARSEGVCGTPHPAIPSPRALYGAARINSTGIDLSNEDTLRMIDAAMERASMVDWSIGPTLDASVETSSFELRGGDDFEGQDVEIRNPADLRDLVGTVHESSSREVEAALQAATATFASWSSTAPQERATALQRAADLLEQDTALLIGLLAREAGKTAANAIAEVREAVDFLRFYAAQVKRGFDGTRHVPLGPVVCISPWNFPLAIFVGQVCASLAAGNTVLAKPAEQTPLVAGHAVRRMWEAGVPAGALQLLPGRGETVGAALVGDARVQAVLFTGSTEVARILQKTLAGGLGKDGQPVPLIAETGGQNAMVVDSSALAEQVVADVMASAFDSAGQRCSALRLLCLQDEAADRIIEMLKGAMAEARIGDPSRLAVDVGPVIDAEARDNIERHVAAMSRRNRPVHRSGPHPDESALARGTYVVPTLIEIERIAELEHEVFGPVLHVVRYKRQKLDELMEQINATGYGLTFGVHTRIDETIAKVVASAQVGNVYVNRNMVGAVVGVQPFGGEGLSGTGPKAGGPLYLYRLLSKRPGDMLERIGTDIDAVAVGQPPAAEGDAAPVDMLRAWAVSNGMTRLDDGCRHFKAGSRSGWTWEMKGPTGERNTYSVLPRKAVLCSSASEEDLYLQIAAVFAVRGTPVVLPAMQEAVLRLPLPLRSSITLSSAAAAQDCEIDAALHSGDSGSLTSLIQAMAARTGPLVSVNSITDGHVPLERLVIERAVSVNTAAAGGNASLMTID